MRGTETCLKCSVGNLNKDAISLEMLVEFEFLAVYHASIQRGE
jgi:hypothetical protein